MLDRSSRDAPRVISTRETERERPLGNDRKGISWMKVAYETGKLVPLMETHGTRDFVKPQLLAPVNFHGREKEKERER